MKDFLFIMLLLAFASYASAQSYYPLSIGNRWTYQVSNAGTPDMPPVELYVDTVTVVCKYDTIGTNGRRYYRMDPYDFTFRRFVSVDSATVRYPNFSLSNDEVVYRLDASLGEFDSTGTECFTQLRKIDTLDLFGCTTIVRTYGTYQGLAYYGEMRFSDKFCPMTQWLNEYDPPTPWPTHTRELIGCTIDGTSYGLQVHVEDSPRTPASFELLPSYPNPFNVATTIQFVLNAQSDVTLVITDALGRSIRHIVLANLSSGTHSVHWDGTMDGGGSVSSGVYFCRLQAKENVATRRMVLLK